MKPFVAALIPAVVLMLVGSVPGLVVGLLSAQLSPWGGALAGVALAGIVGARWASRRPGSMWPAAGVLGAFFACAFAIEGRHARLAFSDVEALSSFTQWDLARSPAVSVPGVRAKHDWAAHFETVQRTKFSSRRLHLVATPLVDSSGRVVAVNCRRASEPVLEAGTVFVTVERFEGELPDGCVEAVQAARQVVEQAGAVVDAAAFERVVRVYAQQAALREDHRLASVTWAAAGGPLLLACFSTWRERTRAAKARRT